MGLGFNKVYYKLNDKTILENTINAFKQDGECKEIIVVTEKELFDEYIHDDSIVVTEGGKTRQESVLNGLKCVTQDVVMIHDGARPYISLEVLNRLKKAMETYNGCLAMVDCKDTIKRVVNGIVETTYDRSTLKMAQTPQVFKTNIILECHHKALLDHAEVTDDASLYELYAATPLAVVEGDYKNIKITTPEDIGK